MQFIANRGVTVQGYSSIIPVFTAVDFVSLYIEIPVMIFMYLVWMLIRRPDPNAEAAARLPDNADNADGSSTSAKPIARRKWWTSDLVDVNTVDLTRDEYEEQVVDKVDDERIERRYAGKWRWAWRVYYALV